MRSNAIKQGPARAPARAMLRATGLDDAAIARPLVAVVHTWTDVSPCNLTLRELAQHVREGVIVGKHKQDVGPGRLRSPAHAWEQAEQHGGQGRQAEQ